MTMEKKRYLAVVEVDVWAEDEFAAAHGAWNQIKALQGPLMYVKVSGSDEPWQSVDLEDGEVVQDEPVCLR
jgi:hypothetical protein